jgi:hypothetical protein
MKLRKKTAELMVWHGMNLLKEQAPEVLRVINLRTLDLMSGHACVLGQGFSTYTLGRRALGLLTDEEAEKFGFWLDTEEYDNYNEAYSRLTETWVRAILADMEENPEFYGL